MKTIIVRFEMKRKYAQIFDSILATIESVELYRHSNKICIRTIEVKESLVMDIVSKLIHSKVNFEMSIDYL